MVLSPLSGVRVLDLTAMPPGGYCTVSLADLGAEVVRVESPANAGRPSTVIGEPGLSRGKRTMTLDSRTPAGVEVLRRLAAGADVLVENNRPGVMAERGFGYAHARESTPRLIWCSITGFGQAGPYADRSGHDLSYLGYSGVLGSIAPELPWQPNGMLSVPIAGMAATTAILAALLERGRTGLGCHIDLSIAEASSWLLSGASAALADGYTGLGAPPSRRLYRCGDGRFLSVAAAEPRTWAALCTGLGTADLADDLYAQGDRADAVQRRLEALFATERASHWVELLGPLGAAVNPVNTGTDLADDPHAKERGSVLEVGGRSVPANPLRLTAADGSTTTTATDLPGPVGVDTDDVLAAAGFTPDEIADLRRGGVV